MFVKPRPYQQDIINKTLETTKSTLIQLPTGGGKTIISKEIAIGLINNFNKKILFVAPKIVLMNQTLETFKGLKPQKVHGYNNKFDKDHHILISTLQTASRRNSLNPDVIIIDEVHFGYEKKMLNKIMEYNQKARIIGLSATPYDENGYPLKGFDVIINDYDLTYMIKNKYLVPLRSYILVKPDLSNVSIIAGDYELNQLSEAVSKNTVIMEIVTTSKPYIEKSLKTIVFAVDINHAELLKTAFQNEGFITESLHSKSEEDDNEVIEKFKKGYIKVLVSVLKLTTGFDVPETDLAIIARPTKSQNLYKQMVGRVLRIAPNKKNAILLDCGNVIENLGKPLEPIIPKDELEKKIQKLKCKHCESENIKLKKSTLNLYWECQDCGHKKELENKNHYKCKNCNKKYSYENGEFELINKILYLNCECGYETEISIATGDEKFREVHSGINVEINNSNIKDKITKYLKFEEARIYIRNLNLKSVNEWKKFVHGKLNIKKIETIPFNPHIYYRDRGWLNWNDWLGIENNEILINNKYLSFDEAKRFVEKLRLKDLIDWQKYCKNELKDFKKKPNYIPNNPEIIYKNQWISWEDFLNIPNNQMEILSGDEEFKEFDKNISKQEYLDFYEAKRFIKLLNLSSKNEWNKYLNNDLEGFKNKPTYLPENPEKEYKNDWISWEDFLGIKNKKRTSNCYIEFLPFEEARNFARKLGIKTTKDWQKYCIYELKGYEKKPDNIPRSPEQVYRRKGWINYKDWLHEKQMDFEEAKKFVKQLNLRTKNEWIIYCKGKFTNLPIKPDNLPRDPDLRYREQWINWEDWLLGSTNKVYGEWRVFDEAKKFIRKLGIKNTLDWKKYCKGELEGYERKPNDIPSAPDTVYKKCGWVNYADWLGTKNIRKTKSINILLPYKEAKKYMELKSIKSKNEWEEFVKSEHFPDFLPKEPQLHYQNKGWKSFDDYLGKKTRKEKNIEFNSKIKKEKNDNKSLRYNLGDVVFHKIFGKGKIIDSIKNGKEQLLTVEFKGEIKKIVSTFLTK